LSQPVEKLATITGPATVETESELFEIRVQMSGAHRSLKGSKKPALEMGGHTVDSR
jgi:hypothetical protein